MPNSQQQQQQSASDQARAPDAAGSLHRGKGASAALQQQQPDLHFQPSIWLQSNQSSGGAHVQLQPQQQQSSRIVVSPSSSPSPPPPTSADMAAAGASTSPAMVPLPSGGGGSAHALSVPFAGSNGRRSIEEQWRAPGSRMRRASHSSVMGPSASAASAAARVAAAQRSLSPQPPSPMRSDDDALMNGEEEWDGAPLPPLFQFFGNGRNHGVRSFSFSVGQPENDGLSPVLDMDRQQQQQQQQQLFSTPMADGTDGSRSQPTLPSAGYPNRQHHHQQRDASTTAPPPGFGGLFSSSSPSFQLSQQHQPLPRDYQITPRQRRLSASSVAAAQHLQQQQQYTSPSQQFGGTDADDEEEAMRMRVAQRVRSRSHSCAQILDEMSPEMVEEMLLAIQHRQAMQAQQQHQQQQQLNRFVPARSHAWAENSVGQQQMNGESSGARRFSALPAPSNAAMDSSELATRYFNNDPALMERRHSVASAMAQEQRMADAVRNMSLNSGSAHNTGNNGTQRLPADFGHQYGNLLEAAGAQKQQQHLMPPHHRKRSWTEPSHMGAVRPSFPAPMTTMPESEATSTEPIDKQGVTSKAGDNASNITREDKKEAQATQAQLYIVEFKGGRNEFFRLAAANNSNSKKPSPPFTPSVGDLVIVEADRGQDLGKCVAALSDASQLPSSVHLSNGMSRDDVAALLQQNGGTAVQKLRTIQTRAKPEDVNQLLDKARDEAKALSICRAKARQKDLPMEIVDVEYQWDRRKLTVYFVAENRIDFRDYVRDLFKIYKTRIWMCAVERSSPGIRLLAASQQ